MPRAYRESLLAPGERIALITRSHALTFWGRASRVGLTALALLLLAVLIEQTQLLPAPLTPARPYITIGLLLLALWAAGSILLGWLRWRAHEILVTDRRVIRISGVLSKEVIDYSLDAIADLRLRQSWLGRLLGYGDVEILTASNPASRPRDRFPVVSRPIAFTHAVQRERERRRQRATGGRPEWETDQIPRVVTNG